MTGRFHQKVVVVTGAAQGIGEGVAEAIANEGGLVILADRSELVKEVAKKIFSFLKTSFKLSRTLAVMSVTS